MNPYRPHTSPRCEITLDHNIDPVQIASTLLNELVPIMNKMGHLLRDKLHPLLHPANSVTCVGSVVAAQILAFQYKKKTCESFGEGAVDTTGNKKLKEARKVRKLQRHTKNALVRQFC